MFQSKLHLEKHRFYIAHDYRSTTILTGLSWIHQEHRCVGNPPSFFRKKFPLFIRFQFRNCLWCIYLTSFVFVHLLSIHWHTQQRRQGTRFLFLILHIHIHKQNAVRVHASVLLILSDPTFSTWKSVERKTFNCEREYLNKREKFNPFFSGYAWLNEALIFSGKHQ